MDYAWPPFVRPEPSIPIAYLDLNHWISLAKAAVGHPDGAKSRSALTALRELRTAGQVLLPLSSTHYLEMIRIRSARQRSDVAGVMEELSDFACLMDRTVVIRLELQEAFCRLLGEGARIYSAISLLGNGGMQAFGMHGGLRVRDREGRDVTDDARARWPGGAEAFDSWQRDAERQLNRSLLSGPSEDERQELRERGWSPEKAMEVGKKRAQQENDQATLLSEESRWRRGRLRMSWRLAISPWRSRTLFVKSLPSEGSIFPPSFQSRMPPGVSLTQCRVPTSGSRSSLLDTETPRRLGRSTTSTMPTPFLLRSPTAISSQRSGTQLICFTPPGSRDV